MPGWSEQLGDCRRFEDLPAAAQAYVTRVEQLLDRPVGLIGVGPDRLETIVHHTAVEELAES